MPIPIRLGIIRSLYRTTVYRSVSILRQSRQLSYSRVSLAHERKEIAVPPPIPAKIQDLILGFRASRSVIAACDLGIFDVLHDSDEPQTAEEVAAKIIANSDATEQLMDLLVALELKSRNGELWLYSNTEVASQYLSKFSPYSILPFVTFTQTVAYPLFGKLETAVREGSDQWMNTFGLSSEKLSDVLYRTDDAKLTFMAHMQCTSLYSSHAVAKAFDLSNFGSCCDLGGNTGLLAYTLCQYYPNMKITVYDVQSPDLPKADLYVLSRIIHDWSAEKVDVMLSNIFNCMPSGGGLLIAEMLLDNDKAGPIGALLQSLFMRTITNGKLRSGEEFKELLEKHGFVDIEVKRLDPVASTDVILCRKS
ncbi:putative bifunctional dTTP/UTP pyrophosphatase/methyltransferase protein [Acropora cervicornis]|uniref:Acetylserotonin O-methyltransferase n=1 Tax=Acropora cervicornis TaxID=6130 RepID=A0AAD9UV43_ACRCE|nr:putative bifunctional dTTP/UTP pyrophosphatase/methyltransferase protein [Acropora cervicornis]